jgi:hypothetical protein
MWSFRYGIAAALVLASMLPAQDAVGTDTRPKELRALDAELKAENARYSREMKALTATEDYKAAVAAKDRDAMKELQSAVKSPDLDDYAERAWLISQKVSGDDRARCMIWTVQEIRAESKTDRALDVLFADYLKAPVMLELCEMPGFHYMSLRGDSEKAQARLSALAQDGATPLIKAWGMYANSFRLENQKDASDEDKAEAAKLSAAAEKLAEGTELADLIGAPRFEKERLQIGMLAPDIVGHDLDGRPMKLSEFRGKVVVVDFWGDW